MSAPLTPKIFIQISWNSLLLITWNDFAYQIVSSDTMAASLDKKEYLLDLIQQYEALLQREDRYFLHSFIREELVSAKTELNAIKCADMEAYYLAKKEKCKEHFKI